MSQNTTAMQRGAGGKTTGATDMTTQHPEALAQECADYATSLRSTANVVKLEGRAPPVSFLRAADLFERAASRIAELESQLAQRFDAADMATAAAQGFRDGVASVSAQAADSVQEDAALWHWLAEYLVGTRTDLDDEIVASETVNDLRKLVKAAIKQGEKQ